MRDGFDELKRRALAGFVVLAGVLLLLGPSVKWVCAEPLRVGFSRDIKSGLIRLANAQGFFRKQGLDVVTQEYESGVFAVSDLAAGKLDMATAAEFVFVLQSFRHPSLRMPATLCISSDNDLVVRKDRAIARPQDLKGKRVAITRGSSAEFFFHNYLIFNRIPADSVRIVHQTPSQMLKAMAEGTIDAALCWPPYTFEMEKQLGVKGSRWPAQSGQDTYFALFTTEGFLKKQPKAMEQFIGALVEAEQFVTKYPDQAQAVLRNSLKTDSRVFLATWSHALLQLQLTQDLLVLMEREAKWAIRNKLVEKQEVPNYLDFFYFGAIDKVKPEAVSIVH
jgi:ABC-type nitrate/sulfonate/bicarbonate transport system substrate-binding protein